MRSEIIAVGTELLMGQIVNTNSRDLAIELSALGVGVYYQSVVGDNADRLIEIFKQALQRTELIIITGGLGPTEDDITRETVAGVLDLPLIKNKDWEEKLIAFFKSIKRPMSDMNLKQAMVPRDGILLPNDRGTAPGILIENKEKIIILLPGPPQEMLPMFRRQVVPLLKEKLDLKGESGVLESKILRIVGLGESDIVKKIEDILSLQNNPTIAPLAKGFEVHLRITAFAKSKDEAKRIIDVKASEIREIIGDYIFGEDDEDLETAVAELLWKNNKTLAVAESCSGGFLSHRLTNIPDSSLFFKCGLVTYSNEAKSEILGIDPQLIKDFGAVSEEVASEMAISVRKVSGADIGLSITGIAGPSGGSAEKPVGLTYIAMITDRGLDCRRYKFWGSRTEVKERASQTALYNIWSYLKEQ